MSRFIDREDDLKTLEYEYNRKEASLVILYGRRRIGKTSLASEFMKDKEGLYFLASEESELQNRSEFKYLLSEYLDNPYLKDIQVFNWNYLFNEFVKKESTSRKVLIIDEFQYIGKSNPAFPSVFQKIWDTLLKYEDVMVILCGSLISMMESQTLNYDSPLYGRRTAQIRLQQIPFQYYHYFYAGKNREELIKFYAVTGGVPKYIELFEDSDNIYNSIQNNILSRNSFLYDEPNFLLQKEVVEIGSYFSIIKAIAHGNQKLSQIASLLEIKQTGLSKYLSTLIRLDIIERQVPITEHNLSKSKKGLYRIKDNFIKFWFAFVYPYMSYLESGHSEIVIEKIKRNFVDQHVSYVYENICKEYMERIFNFNNPWGIHYNKVGRWWDKNEEIDIIAYDNEGSDMIFCECKFWKDKVGINVLNDLERKSQAVIWKNEMRQQYYIIFSINGFSDELVEVAKKRDDVMLLH